MSTIPPGTLALDYSPCRYGSARVQFRGPRRDLSRPYVAVLGGSATFGKYVAMPYAALIETALDVPVANLGAMHAGADFHLSDPQILALAAGARAVVVQLPGAEGLSNRFYTVHTRRNDRVLAATPHLRALYPEVDFADIHFTRHLLQVLQRCGPSRFASVRAALQAAWSDRMARLLQALPANPVLLWLADPAPLVTAAELGPGPLFVTSEMVDALRTAGTRLVEAVPLPPSGKPDHAAPPTEEALAACLPGPIAHAEIAASLVPVIASVLNRKGAACRDPHDVLA